MDHPLHEPNFNVQVADLLSGQFFLRASFLEPRFEELLCSTITQGLRGAIGGGIVDVVRSGGAAKKGAESPIQPGFGPAAIFLLDVALDPLNSDSYRLHRPMQWCLKRQTG